MTRLVLVWLTLALSVLFMFYRPLGQIGFAFSDVVLTADTWFYFLFEHLILLILALVIFDLETKYSIAAATFVAIQFVDVWDYILIYGEPWFDIPITWNVIKNLAYGIVFVIEIQKHHDSRPSKS